MEDWKAFSHWKDLSYLVDIAGDRTVPIELGSSYLSSDASEKLMTLQEFIVSFILGSDDDAPSSTSSATGYLAQHALFEQIPRFKEDFFIPDQCSLLIDEEQVPRTGLPSGKNTLLLRSIVDNCMVCVVHFR